MSRVCCACFNVEITTLTCTFTFRLLKVTLNFYSSKFISMYFYLSRFEVSGRTYSEHFVRNKSSSVNSALK